MNFILISTFGVVLTIGGVITLLHRFFPQYWANLNARIPIFYKVTFIILFVVALLYVNLSPRKTKDSALLSPEITQEISLTDNVLNLLVEDITIKGYMLVLTLIAIVILIIILMLFIFSESIHEKLYSRRFK